MFRFLIFPLLALLLASQPAKAAEHETLPIEIALLYDKLLDRTPPYEYYLYGSDDKNSTVTPIEDRRAALRQIYDSVDRDFLILARHNITLTSVEENVQGFTADGISINDPLIYTLFGSRHYGVFIRNARNTSIITPPYRRGDFTLLAEMFQYNQTQYPVDLILRPLGADSEPFEVEKNKSVNVVLADLVEMRIYTPDRKAIILVKRFGDLLQQNSDDHDKPLSPGGMLQ